jgi:hypothetical protein
MERYYVSSSGGRGWPKCHVLYDRSTVPHTVIANKGRWHLAKRATAVKACAALNAEVGDGWVIAKREEQDSFKRLREWAAQTKAFTEAAYDPAAGPATSFVREAA